jgi:aryl-alcohol dehydrogenase-like predicted oxidoreductase
MVSPIEETYKVLEELRQAGKFKYIGISEPNAQSLRKAAKVCPSGFAAKMFTY